MLWHILHQLLCGLLVLHNKKYSHHDIKPENIFLFQQITYDDFVNINKASEHYRGKIHLKLGDFGQTQRDSCETHHESGDAPADIMGGTRMYRPPEMIEGKSGSYPSDLFSVGVVMCVVTAPCLSHTNALDVMVAGSGLQRARTLSCWIARCWKFERVTKVTTMQKKK